jgi:transcriptional regulator with XRE-family HTH domain
VTQANFDAEAFGARLTQAIARRQLTQSQLAREIGQPRSRVNEWAKGKRAPRLAHACSMAAALGVSLDWLLAGRDPPVPERQLIDELAGLAPTLRDLATRAQRLARG